MELRGTARHAALGRESGASGRGRSLRRRRHSSSTRATSSRRRTTSGLRYATEAGYDPHALGSFFKQLLVEQRINPAGVPAYMLPTP